MIKTFTFPIWLKAIIDFFFPVKKEKRSVQINYGQQEKKIISSVKMNGKTMLFRKQQLPGKILTLGKSHFRVKQRIGETADRLKYQIEQL